LRSCIPLQGYTQSAYIEIVQRPPITVVETVRFLKDAGRLMAESDRAELVWFIAANPEVGDLIPQTGGVRKLRWAFPGRGKNEKANLSNAERNTMAKLVPALIQNYSEGSRRNR